MKRSWELDTGRFLLLVLIFQFLTWPELLLGTKTLCFRDYGMFGYPMAQFHREAFWSGTVPQWNPYNDCGTPFLAQWNTLTLYPGSLIYLLLPLPFSLGFFCLMHQALAAVGMFRLCRGWTGSPWAGAIAGTGFAFGLLALNCVHWPNNIAALGWMPWVVAAILDLAREGWRSKRSWLGLLSASLQMLSGAPEFTVMTWILGGVFAMAHSGVRRVPLNLFRIGIAGVATVLLCAVQLFPFLGFLPYSQRDSGFGGGEWSLPAFGFVNFLLPKFQSYLSLQGVPMQHGQYWVSGYYQGLLILMLACLAVRRSASESKRIFLASVWLVLLGLWMAMGDAGGLHRLFRLLFPQMGLVRFAVKWIVLPCFALPILAALGFARLETLHDSRTRRFIWVGALTLLVAAGVFQAVDLNFPLMTLDPGGNRMKSWFSDLAWQGLFLGLFAFLLTQTSQWIGKAGMDWIPWRNVLLLLLVVFDCGHSFPRSGTLVSLEVFRRGLVTAEQAGGELGRGRAMLGRESILGHMRVNLEDPQASYLIKRVGLFANVNLLDKVAKVDGFFSLSPRWSSEVQEALFARKDPLPLPLIDFLCVRAFSSKADAWEPIRAGRITNWVWGVSRVDASTNLDQVIRRGWEPWRKAWIEPSWDVAGPAEGGGVVDAPVIIQSVDFRSERIQASVKVTGGVAGMVTLAQSWHPAWKVWVDGRPGRVWRVNHGFQGVRVTAGEHQVVWEYQDRWFRFGLLVSALAVLGWVVGWKLCDRAPEA